MPLITVVAPASPAPVTHKDIIENFFHNLGYDIRFAPNAFKNERFLAGTDSERANDLNTVLTDDETDIVMCLRGGYGSPRLLDKLDYAKIKEKNKTLFGFSDNTALQLALLSQCDMVSFTGFNADCVANPMGEIFLQSLKDALNKKEVHLKNIPALTKGTAQGRLIGGTLTLLTGLLGTPYMPDLSHSVLLVEDVHESPYKIDRMLNQLRLSGQLNNLAGVLLAKCADCIAKDPADGDVMTVFKDYFADLSIPVLTDIPYAHDNNHVILPIGQDVIINADSGTIDFIPFK